MKTIKEQQDAGITLFWCLVLAILVIIVFGRSAHAQEYTDSQIASAIKLAENSHRHPYGILRKYCKPGDPDGQCRKGCIQTIEHARKDWDGKGEFISFLGSRYCPIGSNTDNGTCKFWVKNVLYFLTKGR
jgi:hypothetical protein